MVEAGCNERWQRGHHSNSATFFGSMNAVVIWGENINPTWRRLEMELEDEFLVKTFIIINKENEIEIYDIINHF